MASSGQERSGAPPPAHSDRVTVGHIRRAKGVRGLVKMEVLTHRLSRFDEISEVVIEKAGRPTRRTRIESWKPEPPGVLIKFAGVDSPEAAKDEIVEGYVTIAANEVADLPSDQHYVSDLIGCDVVDTDGIRVGRIEQVLEMPTTDVYVVRDVNREILIPAVGHFVVRIATAESRVVVQGIEELLTVQ